MKRFLSAIVAGGLVVLSFAACSTGSTGSGSGTDLQKANVDKAGPLAGKRVLYVDGVPGNALLDGLAQGLAAELNKAGASMVRVFQLNAQNQIDLAAGSQRINEGIAQRVDAIVTFPLDANAIRPGIAAARKAGIPIFTFQALGGLDVTGKVAFPDEARGQATGKALAGIVGGSGTATVLSGIPTDNIEAAVRGAVKGLQEGGLTLVGSPNNQRNMKDDAPEAQRVAQAIFQKNPGLDALVVYNSASATGAIAAAKQAGLAGKVKIATMAGEDTNIAQVRSGQLALSYDLDGLAYGKAMAGLVQRALTGETLDNTVVQAPLGKVYAKDDVDGYVPWTKRLTYVEIPSTF
ncbi:sugar ABC transporter substrate-binding protein [Kribbella shirazensis]|uniref:Ribose transport system substrate-binding protein n=1 Tax=Kribbella shirazensis TaxID=1105143 RepID=A0A7X6A4Z0_9ACTN|nr:sugar ABC transporter substrate-binding protein [Kribbella shirazensis]NIK61505.1 ribose transport system substrate-binding protein [Kribbella shirazensis]